MPLIVYERINIAGLYGADGSHIFLEGQDVDSEAFGVGQRSHGFHGSRVGYRGHSAACKIPHIVDSAAPLGQQSLSIDKVGLAEVDGIALFLLATDSREAADPPRR